jgi:competence protein ComGC
MDLDFEQYRLWREKINSLIEERMSYNKLFITILSGLLAIIPFFYKLDNNMLFGFSILFGSVFGIAICKVWNDISNSFQVKIQVAHKVFEKIELELPHQPSADEDPLLDSKKMVSTSKSNTDLAKIFRVAFIIIAIIGLAITIKSPNIKDTKKTANERLLESVNSVVLSQSKTIERQALKIDQITAEFEKLKIRQKKKKAKKRKKSSKIKLRKGK